VRTFTIWSDVDGFALAGFRWLTSEEPRAVVAISHGTAEHSLRYARFAEALNAANIEVWSIDQRGHGQSPGPEGLGDFGDAGWDGLVADIGLLISTTREARPEVPVGLFAHSMGSFAAQQYILDGSANVDFLVLSGSAACEPLPEGTPPPAFAPNAGFEPARTPYDWLSRDEAEVDLYIADPLCGFETRTATQTSTFDPKRLTEPAALKEIRSELPILLVAGDQDPINRGMQGLVLLERLYADSGIARLDTQYYIDGRHEMLNETNRDEVTTNIVGWIDTILGVTAND